MKTLRQQTAVIVTGPAGAGKSTIAVVLARALPAVLIDNDVTPGTIDPLLTGEARRDRAARGLRRAHGRGSGGGAQRRPRGGRGAVQRGAARRARLGSPARPLCRAGAEAVLAWIRVPDADLLERLAARSAGRDEAKLANPAAWLREADPGTPPSAPHIEIDGTCPAEEAAGALLAALYGCRPVTEREACSS